MLLEHGLTLALVCAGLAIVYGIVTTGWVLKQPAGNERMQGIAAAIQEGARAYLNRQCSTISLAGALLFLAIGFTPDWLTAIGLLIGHTLSGAGCYIGMHVSGPSC